jgi:hypothetical protein
MLSHVGRVRLSVISLPAVEKRRSCEAEVAGTASKRRARRAMKEHKCFSPHLFHSIRGSSVLGTGTVQKRYTRLTAHLTRGLGSEIFLHG